MDLDMYISKIAPDAFNVYLWLKITGLIHLPHFFFFPEEFEVQREGKLLLLKV